MSFASPSPIHRVLEAFSVAFRELKVEVSYQRIEQLASLVHHLMSHEGRFYHSTIHVFDLFANAHDCPFVTLAALFHDTVYAQIHGIPHRIKSILEQYVEMQGPHIFVPLPPTTLHAKLALTVFGFTSGEVIKAGFNEYLSCILALHELHPHVSSEHLLSIACAIEGTIPFRATDVQGHSWVDRLRIRAQKAIDEYKLSIGEKQLDDVLQRCVLMANLDVKGFGSKDIDKFMSNTFDLMPESNHALRAEDYSLLDYRNSLLSSYKFLCWLAPHNIYHSYKGVPSEQVLQETIQQAKRNLLVAQLYLKLKLLTMGILEGITVESGGCEGPIGLYCGDVRGGMRVDHFLPTLKLDLSDKATDETHKLAYSLIQHGRGTQNASFDLTSSPTTSFLIQFFTSNDDIDLLYLSCEDYFAGKIKGRDLLKAFPKQAVREICAAIGSLLLTRTEVLQKLGEEFQ